MAPRQLHRLRKEWTSDSPIPTRVISNEEFMPIVQTERQAHVEWVIQGMSRDAGARLGIDRREFLKTSGGMALALLAMNQVFGAFFDILEVEAFRRFQIPEPLREKHGYPELSHEMKGKIFGLNAARLFGVDVAAKRNDLPKDYLSRIKMAYVEEGPVPSHRAYGWVVG